MATELFDRQFRGTAPDDRFDPPRFGQMVETTKDAFVLALRSFFDDTQIPNRRSELPVIDKYATGFAAGLDPFETTVQIVQEYPDILEQVPHISVTAGGVQNRRLTTGLTLIGQPQYPPRVEGTATGPYDTTPAPPLPPPFLAQPVLTLRYRTQPRQRGVWVESQVVFAPSRFASPAAATVEDVVRVINEQALYIQASVTPEATIRLEAGGRGGGIRDTAIEILGTSDAVLLERLGFSAGQSDNFLNTARRPRNRYHMAGDVTVNVDVISVDPNTRQELADLIYSWATFWIERDNFEIQGRTWDDEDVNAPEEWFHVVFKQEVSMGANSEVPRPGDGKDKLHIQRVTVPVTTFLYLDREVIDAQGNNFNVTGDRFTRDEGMPPRS